MNTLIRFWWSWNGRLPRRGWAFAVGLLLPAALAGCHASILSGQAMNLTSTSFQQRIPSQFTCSGAGLSPQLAWSAPPAGTSSYALVVTDPDAPGGSFVHWVLYDLPAGRRALAEGLTQAPEGARQGRNDFGDLGYGGPCPPPGAAHHYVFAFYALDAKLNLPEGATRAQVETAMQGHVLARGELIGLFQR